MRSNRVNSALLQVASTTEFLLGTIGVLALSLILATIMLVYGAVLMTLFWLVVAALTGLLLVASRHTYRLHMSSEAYQMIMRHLKKVGLKNFKLGRALNTRHTGKQPIRKACVTVYAKCVDKVLSDLQITKAEREALALLREKLSIPADVAARIEKQRTESTYVKELTDRMRDGVITKQEARDLQELRAAIGLSDQEALALSRDSVIDGYRALFRRFASDGRLTPNERDQLYDYLKATGLPPDDAAEISKADALNLYRRTISMVCQDGEVTEEELLTVDTLEKILGLSESETLIFRERLAQVQKLAKIRSGELPLLKPKQAQLRSTELCHWQGSCLFRYPTKTQTKQLDGRLVVTNKRLIFVSPERSFEVAIRRIVNIRELSDGVRLDLTMTKGQGVYCVPDADVLAAILGTLVRRHNLVIAERMDSERSRHIADDVKVAVWQRDGGACVRCGACEYLEYDHIIPFSKGGANTANNIQVLCRRCNLAKGSELV